VALLTSPHNASWPPALLQNCAIDTLKHELRKSILVLKCRPQQTQFHCSEQEAGELLTCTRARHGIQQNPSAENAVGARNRHAYFQARHGNRVTLTRSQIQSVCRPSNWGMASAFARRAPGTTCLPTSAMRSISYTSPVCNPV